MLQHVSEIGLELLGWSARSSWCAAVGYRKLPASPIASRSTPRRARLIACQCGHGQSQHRATDPDAFGWNRQHEQRGLRAQFSDCAAMASLGRAKNAMTATPRLAMAARVLCLVERGMSARGQTKLACCRTPRCAATASSACTKPVTTATPPTRMAVLRPVRSRLATLAIPRPVVCTQDPSPRGVR